MAGDGRIVLKVYRQDKDVCISVKDNGKGISNETIEKILSGDYVSDENAYDNNGIGMDNVIKRLRLFVGHEDVLQIYSEGEGKGCEVVIRLPLEGAKYVQGDDC
jgi:LytS/YehU family sensor histidine kinase